MYGKTILLWLCVALVRLADSRVLTVCPKGFSGIMNACYRFTSNPNIWSKANEECATYKAHLASLDDNDLIESVTKRFQQQMQEARHLWIGLRQHEGSGNFEWSDGSQLEVHNWAHGEPNRLKGEHCVVSYPDGRWNDEVCEKELFGLCQREAITVHLDDSEQSAALDGQEQDMTVKVEPSENKNNVKSLPGNLGLSAILQRHEQGVKLTIKPSEDRKNHEDLPDKLNPPPNQPSRSQPDPTCAAELIKAVLTVALILAACRCIVSIFETGLYVAETTVGGNASIMDSSGAAMNHSESCGGSCVAHEGVDTQLAHGSGSPSTTHACTHDTPCDPAKGSVTVTAPVQGHATSAAVEDPLDGWLNVVD